MVVRPMRTVGREASRGLAKGLDRDVISLRRMTLGSGYRYLMESVAVGDGAVGASSDLTRYYAESGTPNGTADHDLGRPAGCPHGIPIGGILYLVFGRDR